MMILINILCLVFFLYLALNICYLMIYTVAGRFRKRARHFYSSDFKKIAILIPAYKEDGVIVDTALKAASHNYPAELFDVFIIADQLKEETLEKLAAISVQVIPVNFKKSTKARALRYALQQIPDGTYDILMILDADNHMEQGCLLKTNEAFLRGFKMIQLHRTAKNKNTPTAILDAMSEEINNHIFRKGHRALGISSALIGSGMAFDFPLFKGMIVSDAEIEDNPGEDREIYLKMLENGYVCEYVEDALVYDEKVQSGRVLEKQRTRWLSAQLQYAKRFWILEFRKTISTNIHYFDNAIQTLLLPRVTLLFVVSIVAIISGIAFLAFGVSIFPGVIGWWSLLAGCIITLSLSLYGYISFRDFRTALSGLPEVVLSFSKASLKATPNQTEFIRTPKEFIKDQANS